MPAVSDPNTLGEIALFRGLTAEQLSWLNDHLHRKTFPAGSNIVSVEQPGEVVYVILSGSVKIHAEQANGTDVILAILGPGDTVGEMSLLDDTGRSANVVTLEDSTLLWMDRGTFLTCLRRMPAFTDNLMRLLCSRLRQANDQIQALATLSIADRVARLMLTFAQQYGRAASNGAILIPVRLTQSDIAGLVGASRVRVNQAIGALKKHDYISVEEDYHIIIRDAEALAQRCQLSTPPMPAFSPPANVGSRNPTSHVSRL